MLVGERQPDDFELLLLRRCVEPRRRLLLLVGPETVTSDETQRVAPSNTDRKRFVLVVIARSQPTKQSILPF